MLREYRYIFYVRNCDSEIKVCQPNSQKAYSFGSAAFVCFWFFGVFFVGFFVLFFFAVRHLPVGPLQISKFHAAIVYGQRAWVFRHPMIKIDLNNCFYLEGEIY